MTKKSRTWLLVLLVLLALCYAGAKLFGSWGAAQLECNRVQLPAEALPGAGPLRIAVLSDVHNDPLLLYECIKHISAARPGLIILAGDYVVANDRFMRTRWAIEALRRLRSIAPTFAILGNHDYEKLEQVERVFATAGVPILRNQALDWTTPSGGTLRIIGLGDWNEGDEAPATCMHPPGRSRTPFSSSRTTPRAAGCSAATIGTSCSPATPTAASLVIPSPGNSSLSAPPCPPASSISRAAAASSSHAA